MRGKQVVLLNHSYDAACLHHDECLDSNVTGSLGCMLEAGYEWTVEGGQVMMMILRKTLFVEKQTVSRGLVDLFK